MDIHAPTRLSRSAASKPAIVRRIVNSDGSTCSAPIPNRDSASRSAYAVHSATATHDLAPASTAAAAHVRITGNPWRTPRGSRGSGTEENTSTNRTAPAGQMRDDDIAAWGSVRTTGV